MPASCLFKKSVLLQFSLLLTSVNSINDISFVKEYFMGKRITQLGLLLCNEKDAVYLRKEKILDNFLFVTYVKREVNWHSFETGSIGFFVDLSCEHNFYLFEQVPEALLTLGHSWFVAGSLEDGLRAVSTAEVGLSTDLVLRQPDGSLLELYRPHEEASLVVRPCRGLTCPPLKSRFDLGGKTLRGSVVNFLDVSNDDEGKRTFALKVRNKTEGKQTEAFQRKYYALQQILSCHYNYSTSLVLTDTYGYKLPNGSFNGVVQNLIKKESHLGITPISIIHDRLEVVEFTVSLEPTRFILTFLEPRSLGGVWALAIPFSSQVWMAVAVMFALATVVSFFVFYYYHPRNLFSEAVLNVIGVLSGQGVQEMNVVSSRILNLFLLWLGLLLATFYNAAIMNGLLSPTPANIKTIKDLLRGYSLGVANLTYMNPIFFHPLVREKLKTYKKYPTMEITDGIQNMRKYDFAFAVSGNAVYSKMEEILTDSDKCSVREMEMQAAVPMAWPVPKNSHYREMIKQGILLLQDVGIADREKKFWYPETPQCLGNIVFEPVGVKSISIAFFIYTLLMMTAIVVFFLEIRLQKVRLERDVKLFKRRYQN